MKKSKAFFVTTLIGGAAAFVGAVAYKINKKNKKFSNEKWNNDISTRYKMIDSLIRDCKIVGLERKDIIDLLGINGLRSNTKDSMEYYLALETSEAKILILDFDEEDKVVKCTACM